MDQQIKKILEENLELNKEMHKMLKSIKRFMVVQRVAFVLKVLILLIPLILGIVYLPPIIKEYMPKINQTIDSYQSLLNVGESIPEDIESGDTNFDRQTFENLSPEQKQKLLNIIQH